MTRSLRYLFLLVLVALTSNAIAQSGAITGKVLDDKKEPFIGAVVQVTSGGLPKGGDVTDEEGNYTIKPLEAGRYDVKISYTSYKPSVTTGVIVSPDKVTRLNVSLVLDATQLGEATVTAYKVPLIGEDERKVITSDQIEKMPTRSTSTIAATSAGVYQQKEGANIKLGGSRDDGTVYIIDGVRVTGINGNSINIAQNAIDQVEVIQSGLSAKYGDALGGVINITTKGVAKKLSGGILLEKSVDGYGHNLFNFNLSGPLISKRIDSVTKKPMIGFRLDGDAFYDKDNNPSYYGNYKLNDDKKQQIEDKPLTSVPNQNGTPVYKYSSEFVRASDFQKVKSRLNAASYGGRLNGKLDYDVTENFGIAAGGAFNYTKGKSYARSYTLYTPDGLADRIDYTGRAYLRITQRFPTKTVAGEKKPVISNAYYTVQADYQTTKTNIRNSAHGDNVFEYNYVGKFYTDYTQLYQPNGLDEKSQLTGVKLLQDHVSRDVRYERSEMNPIYANYTTQFFNETTSAPQTLQEIVAKNSLINGYTPSPVYGLYNNSGYNYSAHQTQTQNQFAIDVNASFDLQAGKTKHAIEFGLYYQQQVFKGYVAANDGGGLNIWQYARQLTNRHIALDLNNPIFIVGGQKYSLSDVQNGSVSPSPFDTIFYNRYSLDTQSTFDKNLREKLGAAKTTYLDVDNYDPSMLSMSMFSADELLNNGNNFVRYWGYDYLGNKQKGQVNFDDFFTKTVNGVHTRDIGAYRPSYIAGYILDKFQFKDINFNIGVRIDRFDANTKVLKDPYSLYEVVDVAGKTNLKNLDGSPRNVTNTLNGGVTPGNIGSDYTVYVNSNQSSSPNIIGYRNGDNWYDYRGKLIEDPSVLKNYSGGLDPQPLLVRPNEKITDETFKPSNTFADYKPQINVMPRLAFSFPITDQALFFAHYDIIVQRPSLIAFTTPDQYYFFQQSTQNNILSNPDLKPQKLFDYEVGFKQALTKQSAITITGFYKERKDMIQVRPYLFAWPTTYYTYGNRDFSTTKGLTLAYDLRRVGNIRLNIAYTLQFAEGTGSSSTTAGGPNAATQGVSGNSIISQFTSAGLPNLRYSSVLDYDSRHTISSTIDYRYSDNDGPIVGNKHIFENAGINFIFRARSGEPYTKYAQPIRTGNIIEGGVNGARKPWHYGLDLKLDKDFKLGFLTRKPKDGGAGKPAKVLNAFVLIQNVFNIRDVLNVDGYTGRPDDDGYLKSPQGVLNTQIQSSSLSYQDIYTISLLNPDNINLPRRINLGVQFNF